MDRLTSLTVFVAVADCGGFSAAARRLNLSVSTVSAHVQALEDRLGVRLLNRTTRQVGLTDAGKTYYERCRRILADLDKADRVAGALHATPRGTLKIYVGTHIIRLVAPVVAELLALYPALSVELTIGETMVDLVQEGFDVAIRAVPPPDSRLVVKRLAGWRHVLCAAPDYLAAHGVPSSIADLARHNCLRYALYPFGDVWRFQGPAGEATEVRVAGNLTTNSGDALRLLALSGRGIFLAPSFLVAEDIEAERLVTLVDDHRPVEFTINAVYPHRRHLSTKVSRFTDLIARRFVEHADLVQRARGAVRPSEPA